MSALAKTANFGSLQCKQQQWNEDDGNDGEGTKQERIKEQILEVEINNVLLGEGRRFWNIRLRSHFGNSLYLAA